MSEREDEFEKIGSHDLAVEEARPKIKAPPLFRVVLINDDYTPMEFVVDILETVFAKNSWSIFLRQYLPWNARARPR